jgi:hypothetical protein
MMAGVDLAGFCVQQNKAPKTAGREGRRRTQPKSMRIRHPSVGILALGWLISGGACFWETASPAAVQVFTISELAKPADFSGWQVEVPQFNPALGELESVTLDLHGIWNFTEHFNRWFLHDSEDRLTLLLETATGEKLLKVTRFESRHSENERRRDSPGLEKDTVRVGGETVLTAERDLRLFTGSGMADLFLSAQVGAPHSSRRSFIEGFWTAGADIKVIYNYASIPEPSTWWVVDCAVALFALRATRFCTGKA